MIGTIAVLVLACIVLWLLWKGGVAYSEGKQAGRQEATIRYIGRIHYLRGENGLLRNDLNWHIRRGEGLRDYIQQDQRPRLIDFDDEPWVAAPDAWKRGRG